MPTWSDRVATKMREQDQRDRDDARLFEDLCRSIWDPPSTSDGEKLEKGKNSAKKLYRNVPIFDFDVRRGMITVKHDGGEKWESRNIEHALDYMADLMAEHVRASNDAN